MTGTNIKRCLACDAPLGQDDIFCGECGQKVQQAPARKKAPRPNIKKVVPPVPVKPPSNEAPETWNNVKAPESQTPAMPSTRRRLRAFFSGGTVFTLIMLGGLVADMMGTGMNDFGVFIGASLAVSMIALIIATLMKRVSIGSFLLSLLGALAVFLSLGLIAAMFPDVDIAEITTVLILVFFAFAIPAFLFRKA